MLTSRVTTFLFSSSFTPWVVEACRIFTHSISMTFKGFWKSVMENTLFLTKSSHLQLFPQLLVPQSIQLPVIHKILRVHGACWTLLLQCSSELFYSVAALMCFLQNCVIHSMTWNYRPTAFGITCSAPLETTTFFKTTKPSNITTQLLWNK